MPFRQTSLKHTNRRYITLAIRYHLEHVKAWKPRGGGEWHKHALRSICAGLARMGRICISRRETIQEKASDWWKVQLFCHQICGSGEVQTGKLWSKSGVERFIPVLWARSLAGTSPWPSGLPLSEFPKLAIFHRSDGSLRQEENNTYWFLFPRDLEPKIIVLGLNFQRHPQSQFVVTFS